jgi:hypothetical protein
VLHVVEMRDRAHPAGQPLVPGDVAHPLAAEPDLALLRPEPVDILLSRARRHAFLLGWLASEDAEAGGNANAWGGAS